MRTFYDFLKSNLFIWGRNREALFWTFFFPILLMGLMGVVFGRGNAFQAKLAIVNQGTSPQSTLMVSAFKKVSALTTTTVASESQARADLKNGT